jgi:hypothetical protein
MRDPERRPQNKTILFGPRSHGWWALMGLLAALLGIAAVTVVMSSILNEERGDPSQAGVAVSWGRYGPTLSYAEPLAEPGTWHLHCRRSPSQCLRRAGLLCGGGFAASDLSRDDGRIIARGLPFMGAGPPSRAVRGPTLRDVLTESDAVGENERDLVFLAGSRIECL